VRFCIYLFWYKKAKYNKKQKQKLSREPYFVSTMFSQKISAGVTLSESVKKRDLSISIQYVLDVNNNGCIVMPLRAVKGADPAQPSPAQRAKTCKGA
jgi:hypothetical protein